MQAQEILFSLLRSEVCGGSISEEVKASLNEQMLTEVYKLASQHDLAHIAGRALEKIPLSGCGAILSAFKQQTLQAIYRYVKLDYDYGQVCQAFEKAQIPYMPLKGAVLRAYYPEPWMRTSCDTDVLVERQNLERALKMLVRELGFERDGTSGHDISFYSRNGVHFELHHALVEEGRHPRQDVVLKRVWQAMSPVADGVYQQKMPDEMFYFYHIAHMAKHVINGGCGIRPLLDLWILNHRNCGDRQKQDALLEEGGLLTFERTAVKLSEVWFSGEQADALSQDLEKFLFAGGLYGSQEHNVAGKRRERGSGLKYFLSRVFVGYKVLRGYYPILDKHRWLQPFCWLHWWLRRVFGGGGKRLMQEMQTGASMSREDEQFVNDLLDNLEL